MDIVAHQTFDYLSFMFSECDSTRPDTLTKPGILTLHHTMVQSLFDKICVA